MFFITICNCDFSTTFEKQVPSIYKDLNKMTDNVNHPSHYHPDSIEAIEAINAWGLNFQLGNTIKYIARAGLKDKAKLIEDLEKARFYLDYEIKRLKNSSQISCTVSLAHQDNLPRQPQKPTHSNQ